MLLWQIIYMMNMIVETIFLVINNMSFVKDKVGSEAKLPFDGDHFIYAEVIGLSLIIFNGFFWKHVNTAETKSVVPPLKQ